MKIVANYKPQVAIKTILKEESIPTGFQFVILLETVTFNNGNGLLHLKFTKNDKVIDVIEGDWGFKSTIKIRFNWSGYFGYIDAFDQSGEQREIAIDHQTISIFKHTGKYDADVHAAFLKLSELAQYKNWRHFDLEIKKKELLIQLDSVNTELFIYESQMKND